MATIAHTDCQSVVSSVGFHFIIGLVLHCIIWFGSLLGSLLVGCLAPWNTMLAWRCSACLGAFCLASDWKLLTSLMVAAVVIADAERPFYMYGLGPLSTSISPLK